MFWKKKQAETPKADQKAKPVSTKEVMIQMIEQLTPEKSFISELPATFGGCYVHVDLNPAYPNKGKRFSVSTDKLEGGKPSGDKKFLWESDKPKEIASWILDRNGKVIS